MDYKPAKAGSKKSWVWEYLGFVKDAEKVDNEKTICKLCKETGKMTMLL